MVVWLNSIRIIFTALYMVPVIGREIWEELVQRNLRYCGRNLYDYVALTGKSWIILTEPYKFNNRLCVVQDLANPARILFADSEPSIALVNQETF